ncbi:MAG: spore coat protein U domain-containing protein, partial [Rhodanobacteraceae bacterium]
MNTVRSKTTFKTIALAALCAAAGLAPSAIAGEAGAQLRVSVHIVASCRFTVDSAALSFGDVEQDAGSANAQTELGVLCSSKQPYAIGFDYGQHADGAQRRMSDGSNGVAYQLYADASHRTPLGPVGSSGAVRGVG